MIKIMYQENYDRSKAISSWDQVEKEVIAAVKAAGKIVSTTTKFEAGKWEDREVSLIENCLHDDRFYETCKHDVRVAEIVNTPNGTKYWYTTPYVVVATNEGGCCTTGVCLQCLLENTPSRLMAEALGFLDKNQVWQEEK